MSRTRENVKIAGAKLLRTSSSTESIKTEKCDEHQIHLPFHANHCIFCGSKCQAKFMVQDGEITRIKNEKEPSIIERQLKSLFIARNILGVTQKTCHELLTHFDGQFSPEYWLNICLKCNGFVEIYSKNLLEIARLVREAELMKLELKRAIWESNSSEENEEMAFSGVWKEIREQSIIGFKPSQVCNKINQSTQQLETIVKVEREDLNCIISLILLTFLYIWDNDNEDEPGTDATEDVNVEPGGNWMVVTENEEVQMETDAVVSATFVEENTSDSTTMRKTGNGFSVNQNQPNFEQINENNMFSSIYKKLKTNQLNKQIPMETETTVKIATAAPSRNIPYHLIGNHWTTVPINVSRTNGSIIISSKPESPPAEPDLFITHSKSKIKKTYRCTKCPAKFSNQDEFKAHRVLHRKGVPAETCSNCGIVVHCTRLLSHKYRCPNRITT